MPKVILFGKQVRCRPLLDAIGAQEALESWADRPPHVLAGKMVQATWDKERVARAKRRNNAERKLAPDEHAAWEAWRKCSTQDREVARNILIDPPPKETWR